MKSFKLFMLALINVLALASAGHAQGVPANFKEIQGKALSPATELALYRIHSHLKTCENQGFSAARLGILWVSFRAEAFNPRDFVNRLVPPSSIDYLKELDAAATKNPNCAQLTFENISDKLPSTSGHGTTSSSP